MFLSSFQCSMESSIIVRQADYLVRSRFDQQDHHLPLDEQDGDEAPCILTGTPTKQRAIWGRSY